MHDFRNWLRLCAVIDGFRSRYGRWPTRVRIMPCFLNFLREQELTPEEFGIVTAKVELVPDEDAPYIAEDDDGHEYNYASHEKWYKFPTDIRARDWLGNPTYR